MAIDYKVIRKAIKNNPPTDYPDPDDFEDYDEYADAYDSEKELYMHCIAKILGYNSYDMMFKDIEGNTLDEAEEELFDFFYNNMVKEDYYDSDDYSDDDYYDSSDYDDYNDY